ncbi:hypothetical protein [Pseudomonas chlororaphis]|uniref:hypothetical protein n=1 Tax=Pseudomonas chlororaphis TaxID=587753 RepID=UPI000F579431|nr:hypothetical protein [Pseudomonas chlororaphis]AZD98626.1 hypothetical protein C4K12_2760 [Pseudomonas chlororaphis subsp. aureofaciens]QHC92611.1 hypothetical protein PchlR47_31340 [Pseudomonas chlororaphis]
MARIACLGWGSLIWDSTRKFAVQEPWHEDGPLVPVEFARQSQDGRITLVLVETAKPVHSLWAIVEVADFSSAVKALCYRENIPEKNIEKHVCRWSLGQSSPGLIPELSEWASAHDVTHVVWTGLPPKFNGVETTPSGEQVLEYLEKLSGETREKAEQYVRSAPRQIDTEYRRRIEAGLQWHALSNSPTT